MILRDIYCPGCDAMEVDVFIHGDSYPDCETCKQPMRNAITKINADAWGGPQYHPALDMTFDSKSDYRLHMKMNNLMDAGDPVRGARNSDYLGLGKRFSFAGQKNRSGKDYAEPRTHRTLAKPRTS